MIADLVEHGNLRKWHFEHMQPLKRSCGTAVLHPRTDLQFAMGRFLHSCGQDQCFVTRCSHGIAASGYRDIIIVVRTMGDENNLLSQARSHTHPTVLDAV